MINGMNNARAKICQNARTPFPLSANSAPSFELAIPFRYVFYCSYTSKNRIQIILLKYNYIYFNIIKGKKDYVRTVLGAIRHVRTDFDEQPDVFRSKIPRFRIISHRKNF